MRRPEGQRRTDDEKRVGRSFKESIRAVTLLRMRLVQGLSNNWC